MTVEVPENEEISEWEKGASSAIRRRRGNRRSINNEERERGGAV